MNKFDIGYLSILPIVTPIYLYKRFLKNKYKESLPGMMGKNLLSSDFGKNPIWIHSVSVGETVAAKSLIKPIKNKFPLKEIIVSTVTETGQQKAHQIIPEAKKTFYYPLDFSWIIEKFLDKISPSMYLFLETELWPNFLLHAGRRGVPIFLINGKLSEKSFQKYLKFNFIFREPLNQISAFLMQTEHDAEKMRKLVGDDKKIFVTGNVKFDSLPDTISKTEYDILIETLKIKGRTPIIVVGSTHAGEETIFIELYKKLKTEMPNAVMLIVPRHPERFEEVAYSLEKNNINYFRYSNLEQCSSKYDILLVDKMGVLTKMFAAADIAIVGGSFVPVGGHNLLEPAVYSIPVITGPHTFSQKEIMRVMNEENGCIIADKDNIFDIVTRLCRNENERKEWGIRARRAVDKNKGAAQRAIDIIYSLIQGKEI